MIPFEELDKALARWKARSQNASSEAASDAAREFEAAGVGATPAPVPVASGDRTGEIDLEAVVETYEEN